MPKPFHAFALLAVVLGAGACRGGATGAAAQPAPGPRIKPERFRLDLGAMIQDQEASGAIAVANQGASSLEIASITPSRFCSGRIEPGAIAPGQTASLRVSCASDLYGRMAESIDIHSNDASLPVATIQIIADVTPLLAFDVSMVDLRMPFGEERTADVRLVGSLAGQARPRLISPALADADITPLPAPPGKPSGSSGYRARCRGRKVGSNAGNIIITTGLPKPDEIAIPFVCTVNGTLEISPTNPFFNLKVSGDKPVRITVRSSQPNFELHSVRVLEGPFAARFEHAEDDNTYRIDVTVRSERIADESRAAVGTLLIVSNDRTEPRKEVPLFGSGRINKVTAPAPDPARP